MRLAGLNGNKEILVHFDLMFLHEHDSLLHGVNLVESLVFDDFDVSQVSHDAHELLLLSVGFVGLGHNLDTFGNVVDELLDVLDLLGSVVQEEGGVGVDPGLNGLLKLLDKGE